MDSGLGEPQSCTLASLLPQLLPSLLLGPLELLTGVIPEVTRVGAQLSRQQGPSHGPAPGLNPRGGVEDQRRLQVSFSLCRTGAG